jgi:hypothetical protein
VKVWITKYALTSGVIETDARVCEETNGIMIEAKPYGYFHKPDWHDNKVSAEDRVCDMINKQLASLEKQLDKLRKLDAKFALQGLSVVMKKEKPRERPPA